MTTPSTVESLIKRSEILLHPIRSVRFLFALMADKRVSLIRKAAFVLLLAGMCGLLLFPDLIEESILSAILPLLGTILGIPLGVGFDWVTFAMFSVHIFGVFPVDLVNEHYTKHVLRRGA